jgi:hypothetical protein
VKFFDFTKFRPQHTYKKVVELKPKKFPKNMTNLSGVDTMYVYLGAEERNQMEAKGNLDFLK